MGDDTVDEECIKSVYINPETEVQQGLFGHPAGIREAYASIRYRGFC